MIVVRAGREFETIATNPMGELLMATPALSGGALFVRSDRGVLRSATTTNSGT